MTFTSADFVFLDGQPDDFFSAPAPDDMQDVPLSESTLKSTTRAAPSAPVPPPERQLLSPPSFNVPHCKCGLSVRVHTPETVTQRATSLLPHTVYQVATWSSLSSFPKESCSVRRRFSDFDSLYHVLRKKYTGYFIPPLPDKDIVQGRLVSGPGFLDKRTQDLELFINECCTHKVLQASSALQLFLTLDCESLVTDPQWKRVEDEDCVFHSLTILRRNPQPATPRHEPLPSPNSSSTIEKLGAGLKSGVGFLTGKVKGNILSSAASAEAPPLSPQSVDAVRNGDSLSQRASHTDCLLLRWAQASQALHSLGLATTSLSNDLRRLWSYEEKGLAAVKLPGRGAEKGSVGCSQAIAHQKRVAHAALHVGNGTQAFAKKGEVAAAPLRVVACGMHGGRRAFEDRCVLRAAIADHQAVLQEKKDRYRLHSSEAVPSDAQAAGVADLQRSIAKLEARLAEMRSDYDSMCKVHEEEMGMLTANSQRCSPLAALQMGQLLEELSIRTAQQWEAVARSLGATEQELQVPPDSA